MFFSTLSADGLCARNLFVDIGFVVAFFGLQLFCEKKRLAGLGLTIMGMGILIGSLCFFSALGG